MEQTVPRPSALSWVYQFFPYLQAQVLDQTEFTNDDLQTFCIITQYPGYESQSIYNRLKDRNDAVIKREQQAQIAAASKKAPYSHNQKYSGGQQQYSQPQYSYMSQQYYDQYQIQMQAAQYQAWQQGQIPDYSGSQSQPNNYYNQPYKGNSQNYNQKPNYRTYDQNTYNQSHNIPQYQQVNDSNQQSHKIQSVPTQSSPIIQKNNEEKQTAPSTPAPVTESAKQVSPKSVSFTELRKAVIQFKDFSKLSADFKSKVEQINKRQPVYEQLKVNVKNKNTKSYNNQNRPQQQPAQVIQRNSGNNEQTSTDTSSALVCKIIRKVEDEQQVQLKKQLLLSSQGGGIGMLIKNKEISEYEKAQKEIKFNLNLITLQNFTNIKKELAPYVTKDEKQCQKLIHLMIEKAWIQPKFAVIYAKLSSQFGRLNDFKWGEKKDKGDKKGSNPFKTVLIKVVQEVFQDDFSTKSQVPQVQSLDTKMIKKKIIGNVRFIGQLVLQKVLSKKIIYYCIAHLLESFFKNYSKSSSSLNNQLAEIYFEALIELIQKVGDKFENKQDKIQEQKFKLLEKKVDQAARNATQLTGIESDQWLLSTERFFDIFNSIDKEVLMGKYPRISALLKNLTQRKDNNWASHVVENKGPMTLNDARKEEEARVDHDKGPKKPSFDFEKQWNKIFAKYDKGKYLKQDTIDQYIEYKDQDAKEDLKKLFKQDAYELVSTYIRIFADAPRPVVQRRVTLFSILFDMGFSKLDHVKQGWIKNAGKLCYSDLPLAAIYFPKIMVMVNNKFRVHIEDWEIKKSEDQEEIEYSQTVINNYRKQIKQ